MKERCWFLILFIIFASFLQNIGSPYFNFNSKDLDNFILSMDAEECILLISVLFLRVFYHFEVPIKSVKWQSLKKKIVKLNSLSISQLYSSHFHSASEFWRNPLNVKLLNRVDYFRRTKTLFQIIMHFYAPVSNYLRYHLEPPDLNLTFICRNNFFRAFPTSISAPNVWWCFPNIWK